MRSPRPKPRRRNDFHFTSDKESQRPFSFVVDGLKLQMFLVELKKGVDIEFDQFATWDVALDSILSDLVVDVLILIGMETQDADVIFVGVVFIVGIGLLVVGLVPFLLVVILVFVDDVGFRLLFGRKTRRTTDCFLGLAVSAFVPSVPFFFSFFRAVHFLCLPFCGNSIPSLVGSAIVCVVLS